MPWNGYQFISGERSQGRARVGIVLPLGAGTFGLKCGKGRGLRQSTLRNKQAQLKALEKNLRDKLGKENQGGAERIQASCHSVRFILWPLEAIMYLQ